MDTETLLTQQETADMLRLSPHTLAYWRRPTVESDLPWVEVGGQVRYRMTDIRRWLDSRTRNGTPA